MFIFKVKYINNKPPRTVILPYGAGKKQNTKFKHMRYSTASITLLSYLLIALLSSFQPLLSRNSDKNSVENDWPREIKTKKARIVIFQPQVENFTGDLLESRAAIAVTVKKSEGPVFGAAWFENRVSTDKNTRMVSLKELTVTDVKFPDASEEDINSLVKILETEMPKWTIEISLDRLLASMDEESTGYAETKSLNNAAPEIIFSTTNSILVVIDGEPIYKEIEGLSKFQYILNTPFFIATDTKKKDFFLYGDKKWYTTQKLSGNWKVTKRVPDELDQIIKEAEKEKEKSLSSEDLKEYRAEEPIEATIFLRTSPSELIQSDGDPQFGPIEGTQLLYMTNSENDVLMDISSQSYYILVSGRWYTSKSMKDNKWVYVSQDKLPAGFSEIPAESDMGNILASVAGTQEAKEALLENTIPQTATVDRKTATVEVEYDGDPQFKDIDGTEMAYAENTSKSVLKIENKYYCVDDGIWFEANSAKGPWTVSVDVPDDVQDIPPESPVYNVKYVYVYDYTPDVVYVGYTPAYMGSYIYYGCVVYGTGYYYRPWYHHYYYPRPVTYGFGVHYNPYTGWGFSYGISFGWMSVSWGHPHYGGWWGPAGYHYGYRHGYRHGYHHGYNRGYKAGYYAGSRNNRPTQYNNRNLYSNRASGVAQTRPKHRDSSPSNRVAVDNRKQVRPSAQVPGTNDVFTDKAGNVHRRTSDGWQTREDGQWKNSGQGSTDRAKPASPSTREIPTRPSSTQKPANTGNKARPGTTTKPSATQRPANLGSTTRPSTNDTYKNLNKSYESRQRGTQNAQNYRSTQSKSQAAPRKPATRSSGAGRRR